MGKKASEQMGLIQLNCENISAVNNDNNDNCDHVFKNELGKLAEPVHLTLDESIMPESSYVITCAHQYEEEARCEAKRPWAELGNPES